MTVTISWRVFRLNCIVCGQHEADEITMGTGLHAIVCSNFPDGFIGFVDAKNKGGLPVSKDVEYQAMKEKYEYLEKELKQLLEQRQRDLELTESLVRLRELTISHSEAPKLGIEPGGTRRFDTPIGPIYVRALTAPANTGRVSDVYTVGGYAYRIKEMMPNRFQIGEVLIPTNEWVSVVWDDNGNPTSISNWPGNIMALCKLPPEAVPAKPPKAVMVSDVAELLQAKAEAESAAKERLETFAEAIGLTEKDEAIPPNGEPVPQPVAAEEPAPNPPQAIWKHDEGQTSGGLPYFVFGVKEMGYREGVVRLPTGENVTTSWDTDGHDIGGRPNFKIPPL